MHDDAAAHLFDIPGLNDITVEAYNNPLAGSRRHQHCEASLIFQSERKCLMKYAELNTNFNCLLMKRNTISYAHTC